MFARDVAVVGGCGHVGLPLAALFADRDRSTAIFDRNAEAIALVRAGRSPFLEEGLEPLLARVLGKGTLTLHDAPEIVSECRWVVIVVGTPVDEYLNPRVDTVLRVLWSIRPHLRDGQTLVLRSTVYPGVTAQIASYLSGQGLSVDVAYCPERVAQGAALAEITALPQIVSGTTPAAVASARALFEDVAPEIVVLEPMEAELAKLFNNAWRYVTFAIANQFFTTASEHGLDFDRIHEAMTRGYPRAHGIPGPGFAAGPCLLKDTMQLATFGGPSFLLGQAAMLVNEGLPDWVAKRMHARWDLSDKTVGILGMAFKADSDDIRDSLSFRLKKRLALLARAVLCTDPHVSHPDLVPQAEVLARADLFVIGVPHREYRTLVLPAGKPVVDPWSPRRPDGVVP